MRVIITGGTGMIGQALAASLAGDGFEVVALSRSPEKYRGGLPQGVRLEKWDGKSADGWGRLASGADAIVNLAGENLSSGRWTASRKRRIIASRANAGHAVVQAVQDASPKPKVVIQASGTNYYGIRGDEEVTENTPPGDDFLSRVCIQWEAASGPVEAMGVRRVVTRSGVVLSPTGGALKLMTLPFRLFVGGPLGGGRQWLPWVHLDDEVAAIRYFIDHPETYGAYNLVAPQQITNADFARAAGKALGRPSFFPTPAFPIRLALGEMSMVVLEGSRVVAARLRSTGFQFRWPEIEPALHDLLRKERQPA